MQNVSDLIFAAGMALPSPSTPIAVQYDLLLLTFVFREKDGIILDAEANMVCDITSTYLRYLLVGRCIYTDVDQIIWEIEHTYLGCCFANKLRKIFIQSAKKKRRLKGF